MEKYSAFRDPGTGIQPFLPPIPPQGSETALLVLKPFLYIIGLFRTVIVLFLAVLYVILVQGLCSLFSPVAFLFNALSWLLTAVLARSLLFTIGLYWIPSEVVRRKRGRTTTTENWRPEAGAIVVSNWISWLEIVWMAVRFNPVFALPIASAMPKVPTPSSLPSPARPGRRTGTGSAAVSIPIKRDTARIEIAGFKEVSLLQLINHTGQVPLTSEELPKGSILTLDSLQKGAKVRGRPLVIFPEGTTSNGRGLLRFASIFKSIKVPVKEFPLYVMCVRVDPPKDTLHPTLSHSVPSLGNPLKHVFLLSSTILPHSMSIRLLAPSESPSSGTFLVSDVLPNGGTQDEDILSDICSILIADIGRMKRTGMGWEDKAQFFEFYKTKSSR